jgi:hypothetical protein
MPIYLYQNPKTQEVIEVIQKMKDDHVYFDESGLEWKRIWVNPQMRVGSYLDPYSFKDFDMTSANKNYTVGEVWERAAEMSGKRAEIEGGVDPIKEKWKKDYSKKRKGTKYTPDGKGLMGGGEAPSIEMGE